MSFEKFDIVKFDGFENFELWQMSVEDLLLLWAMVKALREKQPEGMHVTN